MGLGDHYSSGTTERAWGKGIFTEPEAATFEKETGFTRIDAGPLLYEFTVVDPKTWTGPWTVQVPMSKSNEPMYEYACHEGNDSMENVLAGARSGEERQHIGQAQVRR